MFSLIITIIAILLVAALALATLYYGGSVATDANVKAQAAALDVQGQQLRGAYEMAKVATGQEPTSAAQLVSMSYLTAVPEHWGNATDHFVSDETTPVDDPVCKAFNATHHIDGIPACSDPAYDGQIVCCSAS